MSRSPEDLRSSLRAVTRKADKIANEAANITGILPLKPGRKFWCVTEINWDDPRLTALKETYFKLIQDASDLQEEIARLDTVDAYDRFVARKRANHFLNTNFNTIEEEAEWLQNHGGNALALAERILENPNYLREVEL